jgi:hypothetical protein
LLSLPATEFWVQTGFIGYALCWSGRVDIQDRNGHAKVMCNSSSMSLFTFKINPLVDQDRNLPWFGSALPSARVMSIVSVDGVADAGLATDPPLIGGGRLHRTRLGFTTFCGVIEASIMASQ